MSGLPFQFVIPGTPAPGGSKTAIPARRGKQGPLVIKNQRIVGNAVYGHPVMMMIDAGGAGNVKWKKACAAAVQKHWHHPPLEGPLILEVTFVVARPKNHYRTGKFSSELRIDAPVVPFAGARSAPDVTKLGRSTEDALTQAKLWNDDCQVVEQMFRKVFAKSASKTGAIVRVSEWSPLTSLFTRKESSNV